MAVIRIALATAITAALTTLAASNAFGQALEVTDEATTDHCPAVTLTGHSVSSGCSFHAVSTGPVTLRQHVFGVESTVYNCDWEFTLVTDEDANGYLVNQSLTGVVCERRPCQEADGTVEPWPASGSEPAAGQEQLTMTWCVEDSNGGNRVNCELDVPFTAVGDHSYEFGTLSGGNPVEIPCHGTAGFRGELIGHWISEGAPNTSSGLEIAHL